MNKDELKDQLIPIFKKLSPILIANNKPGQLENTFFCSEDHQNSTYVVIKSKAENDIFESALKLLTQQRTISSYYSENFIRSKFIETCHKLIKNQDLLSDYVISLISFFFTNNPKDFFVIAELENIRLLTDQKYELVDCTLKLLKKEDLPFKLDEVGSVLIASWLDKRVIFTWVKAGESEKAKEMALHNFTISFNLLRVFAPNFKPSVKGCLLSGQQNIVLYDKKDQNLSSTFSQVGDLMLNRAYLDQDVYVQLQGVGIDELKNTTQISKILRECLYWYGLGLDETYPSARLINFVTVLEAILKKKNETAELRRAVSERGAMLLSDKFNERKEIVTQLKEIYDIRSKVVHTGVLIEDTDIASLAGGYARGVIIKIIELSKRFNGDFDDFINYLDDLKLKGDAK